MSTLKFFYVFVIPMPSEDKLEPNHTVIYIVVSKHIGAETCAYGEVVGHLIIQGKAKVPDVEILPHFNAIYF
jgi:hypothetical protein